MMPIPTKDAELLPAPASTESRDGGLALVVERLAANPQVDVEKLERIIALQERFLARAAEEAFNAAMAAAQLEMRPIAADASNPQTHSRYASYAALDRALRPIYTKHGLAISYDTGESPLADHVRVLAYVRQGRHKETYHLDMPNDGKGAKGGDVMTKTHATGAAMSYGMRYLLKMIFNVSVGEDDRDGNAVATAITAPAGFDEWADDLAAVAEEGLTKLQAVWAQSKPDYKRHLLRTNPRGWNALKAQAAKVPA